MRMRQTPEPSHPSPLPIPTKIELHLQQAGRVGVGGGLGVGTDGKCATVRCAHRAASPGGTTCFVQFSVRWWRLYHPVFASLHTVSRCKSRIVMIIKLGVTILHIMESLQNRDATAAAASDVHHCTCPSNSTSLGCNDSCGCNAAALRDGVAATSAQIHNGGGAAALNEACGSGTCGDVASSYTLPVHARKGQVVPYTTFVSTMPILSTMPGAGTGLAALGALEMFTWVGLYPGSVTPACTSPSPWRFSPVLSHLATAPPTLASR